VLAEKNTLLALAKCYKKIRLNEKVKAEVVKGPFK